MRPRQTLPKQGRGTHTDLLSRAAVHSVSLVVALRETVVVLVLRGLLLHALSSVDGHCRGRRLKPLEWLPSDLVVDVLDCRTTDCASSLLRSRTRIRARDGGNMQKRNDTYEKPATKTKILRLCSTRAHQDGEPLRCTAQVFVFCE
jgi:hypothetical protein